MHRTHVIGGLDCTPAVAPLARIARQSLPRALVMGVMILTVVNSGFVAPVLAQPADGGGGGVGLGGAICQIGGGKLITSGLWVLSAILFYSSILDGYRGLKEGQSGNSTKRAQQSSSYGDAFRKLIGAVVIAGSPVLLATLGFSFLSCVQAINIGI